VTPEIVAHRGYSARAPENTLAAIEAALRTGVDAVEWDVHTAACGTAVLIHDAALGRTTNGVGPVRRRTFAQLQALDAGTWFAPDFAGERIVSLAQALDRVKGRVGRVYTEIKGYRELEDLDRMARVVRDADMAHDTVFISLDWGTVERIAGRDDEVGIGYIVADRSRFDEALERAAASARAFVDLDHRLVLLEPELVERAHRRGVEVGVWTVDDPSEAERVVRAGVTRVTTNEVELLLDWRRARRAEAQRGA
jgi:glycerophosphoryl diester phosphodiesterase